MFPGTDKLLKGIRDPRKAVRYVRNKYHPLYGIEDLYLAATSRFPVGTHMLDREWDLLVILDTCRVDALRSVAPEYSYLGSVDRIWSLGGTSPEWIAHTFDARYRDELRETAYLCANPHGGTVLDDRGYVPGKHGQAVKRLYRYGRWNPVEADDVGLFDRIWAYDHDTVGDTRIKTQEVAPKRYVTDRAIKVGRDYDFNRMILHYMQPHYPYVANAIADDREVQTHEERPRRIRSEGKEPVWSAYVDHLRYVLDELELLFVNIDADTVVISSDHGDCFGERGIYGHDPGRFHPAVRFVPWAETSASDTKTYEPSLEPETAISDDTSAQLEALGYR